MSVHADVQRQGRGRGKLVLPVPYNRSYSQGQPSFKRSQREHGPISQNQMARAQPREAQICQNLTGLMVIAEGAQTARTSMPVVGAVDPIPHLGARRELERGARRMHRKEQSRLERWRKSPHVYCSVSQIFHAVLSDSKNRGKLNRRG